MDWMKTWKGFVVGWLIVGAILWVTFHGTPASSCDWDAYAGRCVSQ